MFALFATIMCVGTAELIVVALLPNLAADLAVDIPTAGLLITGYAIGVAVASPVLTLLTGSVPRRNLLLAMLGAFVVGNALCAVATVYWALLAARIVVACCHGVLFGIAMVIAIRIAPAGRQTTAISMLVSGFTIATILGVPVGTAIGNALGWRAAFWAIAGIGTVAAVVVALLVPPESGETQKRSNLAAELRASVRPFVLIAFTAMTLYMVGVFVLYAYLIPLVTTVSGIPVAYVPLLLFGMGFVGFFGNLASGRLADWKPYATMLGIISSIIVLLLIFGQVVSNSWGTAIVLWLIWLIGFGYAAPARTRVLKAVADAPNFTSTLTSTAFNIGIAAGAAIGGAAIAAGWGYGALPYISACFCTLALVMTLVQWSYERRVPSVTAPA
jgi:MFS transporter, DHA1 family, inner membrane transport protein